MFRFLRCLGAHNWDDGENEPVFSNQHVQMYPPFILDMLSAEECKFYTCKSCGKQKWHSGIPISFIQS